MSATRHEAAIVTVGSELTLGLRLDTNTQQVAAALSRHGYLVAEAITMADDVDMLASALARLCDTYPLVIVTGGLGPTHDDVTRDAAARALSIPLEQDESMLVWLEDIAKRHGDPAAAAQVFRQAEILTGATILRPASGTAPGQIARTELGRLVLLPGPPHEMYPMLLDVIGGEDAPISTTLRCVGVTESDAQVRAGRIVSSSPGVTLTVLASPSMVDVILVDTGAGEAGVGRVAEAIEEELADYLYGREEATLAGAVLGEARDSDVTLALAESCTGGMLAAALTDEAGASDVFQGGVVAYANAVKSQVLGVEQDDLEQHGAVSARVAEAMASGVADRLAADIALSVTGIAGPGGGTDEKPVGLVWFGLCDRGTVTSFERQFPGDRLRVRTRAVVAGLNALRLALRS